MEDQIFIQHRFTITEGDKTFTDAIVLPIEDYQVLKPEEIEEIKQERFDTWLERIENPVEDQ